MSSLLPPFPVFRVCVLMEGGSYPILTRFFAHLCLYLQLIDMDVPPVAMQVILEAYLQVLEVCLLPSPLALTD